VRRATPLISPPPCLSTLHREVWIIGGNRSEGEARERSKRKKKLKVREKNGYTVISILTILINSTLEIDNTLWSFNFCFLLKFSALSEIREHPSLEHVSNQMK
jgi:hypothetical protein